MLKQLRYFFTLLLLAVASVGFAEDPTVYLVESVTFSDNDYENGQAIESYEGNYFTISFDKGSNSNAPKYYNTGSAIRCYGGNTFTITKSNSQDLTGNHYITQIVLTFASGEGSNDITVTDENSLEESELTDGTTWTGEKESVTFTIGGTSGHRRIASIQVTLERIDTPAPPKPTNPTITPNGGEVEAGTEVQITFDDSNDNVLYYAFDYDSPNPWSVPEENPSIKATESPVTVTIDKNTTLYAQVYNAEVNYSDVISATFTIKEAVEPSEYETVSIPYEVDFTEGQDKFVIEDVTIGEGLQYVWSNDTRYGMKASAYVSGTNYDAESWLVSPLVDLSENTGAANLTFEHALNFFSSIDKAKEEATVWVREEGGEWSQLEVSYPEKLSWSFVESGVIDLSSYNGKKIQIGFKYISTAAKSGTWEIKNFNIVSEEVIELQDVELSFGVANFTATIGEDNEFPVLTTNPENLAVTYSSTNTSVATISETGDIELIGAGQTTIKAEFAGDETYKEGSASYLLVVKEQEIAGTDKFELVTDASTLADGDVIILAFVDEENKAWALSTTQNANNRAANEATLNEDGTITPGSSIQQITLEDGFYFNVGEGYLYAASSKSNWLRTETEADENASATIDIAENGDATIVFQGANTRNNMRYNANNGSPIFSCYANNTSVETLPRIYRKVAQTEEEIITVNIGSTGYATLFYSNKNLMIPEGVTASIVTAVNDKVIEFSEIDYIIPAGTGVVLQGEPGNYDFVVDPTYDGAVPGNNLLNGSDEPAMTEGGDIFYKLTVKNDEVGFYWGADEGAAFENGAHKAYLALPAGASNAKFFIIGKDGSVVSDGAGLVDGINEITAEGAQEYYNLNGVRVNTLRKGIYIVGGKKVIIK